MTEPPPKGQLPFPPPLQPTADLVPFWRLWGQERFWACHEALEEVWHHAPPERRLFLNGLIHAAVAVFQHRRGNSVGAARQFVRASAKLHRLRPKFEELDLNAFLAAIEREIAPSRAALSGRQIDQLGQLEERLMLQFGSSPIP